MAPDLGSLQLDQVIVHDVPARKVGGGGAGPTYSDVESPLTTELANYFREKIAKSLASSAYAVELALPSDSPMPTLVQDQLGPRLKTFIAMSQEAAGHLYASQKGSNPPGLLILVAATVAGAPALGILKLEREDGVRVHPETRSDGHHTFSLEVIRDLMLTERTRVFKAGLFVKNGADASIDGLVSDKQRGYLPTTEVADFFLKKFLGCKLRESPEVTTKRFFQAAETFINEQVDDPAVQAQYHVALLAELNSQPDAVAPRTFAWEHLESEHRQPFVDALVSAEVPTDQFQKDRSLIAPRLKRTAVDFTSGLLLMGPPDAFDAHVTIESAGDGQSRVEIVDTVKKFRGK